MFADQIEEWNRKVEEVRKDYDGLVTKDNFLAEYRLISSGDSWAECMGAWFDVAGEMYARGLTIPAEWRYSPGMCVGIDPDSNLAPLCALLSDEDLIRLGNLFDRYARYLRYHGESY